MTRKTWGLMAELGLLATLPLWGGVVHVAPGGAGTAPYDSWQTAANNIQTAVSFASDGDTVLIADGIYPVATIITVSSDLTLRGVSEGAQPTIDGGGLVRCLRATEGTTVHLDNLRFVNGLANAKNQHGAGVSMFDGSVTDCVFSNNVITYSGLRGAGLYIKGAGAVERTLFIHNTGPDGGGMCADESTAMQVVDCDFIENDAGAYGGGGLSLIGAANVLIDRSRFVSNVTTSSGGGLQARGAPAVIGASLIRNSLFAGNSAGDGKVSGGGILVNADVDPYTIRGCIVTNNTAGSYGGGIAAYATDIYDSLIAYNSQWPGDNNKNYGGGGVRIVDGMLMNCRIEGNVASYSGSGILARDSIIRNCLVIGNERKDGLGSFGGAIRVFEGADTRIENCTIADNSSDKTAGGLNFEVPVTVVNTIIYGNSGSSGNIYLNATSLDNVFINSCIGNIQATANQNMWTNTILANPLLTEEYTLEPKSPCVNSGLLMPWMADARDLAGSRRVDSTSGKVDMGCFELIPEGLMMLVR